MEKMKFFTSQEYFTYTGGKKKIGRLAWITGSLSTLMIIILGIKGRKYLKYLKFEVLKVK